LKSDIPVIPISSIGKFHSKLEVVIHTSSYPLADIDRI
jgi:hypothetical protein